MDCGKNRLRVVITDAYHDSDRGGTGILSGLLERLRKVCERRGIDVEATILFRYSEDDPRFADATRHTRIAYPEVRILGSPLSTRAAHSRNRGVAWLRTLQRVLRALSMILVPNPRNRSVAALRNAELVISKGGHFYRDYSRRSLRGGISTLFSFHTAILALRLRRPLHFFAHTFGPFRNWAGRSIARTVLLRAKTVGVRETLSRDYLESIGIPASRLTVIPDSAFGLEPATEEDASVLLRRYGLSEGDYAVITAMHWPFPALPKGERQAAHERYLQALAMTADSMLRENLVRSVAVVVHNDGRHQPLENDGIPARAVLETMQERSRAVFIAEDLTPQVQAAVYGRSRIALGTRMHSCIFALVGGAPVVAIAYTHKTTGIMQMMGLSDYVVDIHEITTDACLVRTRQAIADADVLREKASSRVAELVAEIDQSIEAIICKAGG